MVTRDGVDAETSPVAARPSASDDTTQVVDRSTDSDTTQVVGLDPEATQVVSGGAVPEQRVSDDSETTTVIPPPVDRR
ncbi:hypothetical protein [Micromonospora parastrephiae]|uniref:hypothetical protein n=1 Tax=Micromonospora parastrephiae TaxID=2806101 RepID=UPI001EE42218|nr:hypothetical protein [Micromonospora parastrephiae]